MAKTYADLRDAVAAYMHREAGAFMIGTFDALLLAANNAKNFCQRAVDFERARVFAQLLDVSITSGKALSDATLFGTATPVAIKSVEKTFMADTGGNQFPVEFISRKAYVARLAKRYEMLVTRDDAIDASALGDGMFLGVMQYGNMIYPVPNTATAMGGATVSVYFDAVEWIADFAATVATGAATSVVTSQLVDVGKAFITLGVKIGDVVTNTTTGASAIVTSVVSQTTLQLNAHIFPTIAHTYNLWYVPPTQTNFLLDYAFDYMLFRTIYELNFFLKEDLRVPISKAALDEIWNNVVRWNDSIIGNSVDDATLS